MKNIDPGTGTKRKKSMVKAWLIGAALLMSVALPLFAQSQNNLPDLQSLSSLLSITQQTPKQQALTSANGLIVSVDENEYRVDSGDEFYIRVDVKGPDVKMFNLTVSADGLLIFPDVSALNVRGLVLKEAKQRIFNHLKNFYKTNEIDISLAKIHKIRVSLIGALQPVVPLDLTSADRLVDAIQKVVIAYQADTTRVKMLSRVSVRRVDIIRNKQRIHYDLLKFVRLGDLSQNPLLRTNDVIFVHYRDSLKSNLSIGGQVGRPGIYEYVSGDTLGLVLSLAGGLLPVADSSRIEVYRQHSPGGFRRVLALPRDRSFRLQPGDQIFVRAKKQNREQKYVQVEGEVKFPGLYPIREGQTRLSDVLKWCGGFTKDADLQNAFVQRKIEKQEDLNELFRLLSMAVKKEWPTSEQSFMKDFYRQKRFVLQVDFNAVLKQAGTRKDYLLKDDDVIMVPAKSMFVTVSGGVKKPGIYPYVQGFTVKDYVNMAGGYSSRVKKSLLKIIKGKSGAWLDAKESAVPESGDQIFIPQRNEIEFWPAFKEAIGFIAQIGTIFVIIRSVK